MKYKKIKEIKEDILEQVINDIYYRTRHAELTREETLYFLKKLKESCIYVIESYEKAIKK